MDIYWAMYHDAYHFYNMRDLVLNDEVHDRDFMSAVDILNVSVLWTALGTNIRPHIREEYTKEFALPILKQAIT